MENPTFWKPTERSQLAKALGLSRPQRVTDYINGHRRMSVKRAQSLEAASADVLGYARRITAEQWLRIREHPGLDPFRD